MEADQSFRKLGRDIRARIAGFHAAHASARAARAEAVAEAVHANTGQSGAAVAAAPKVRNSVFVVFSAIGVLIVLYPLLAWLISNVDDDLSFAPKPVRNQSAAVAAIGALVDREVNQHDWTPSAPFFSPAALLEDMPNFQRGMVAELARVTDAFAAQTGVEPDPDLKRAAELLNYPPDVWLWNPAVSFFSGSSQQQYRKAIEALASYNARLSSGETKFDTSPAALAAMLDSIGADLNQSSAMIEDYIRGHNGVAFDRGAGEVFYAAKGGIYADYIVMKALPTDFSEALETRGLSKSWDKTMASFEQAARMHPYAVMNGAPDSSFVPCHLCNEGFYLARARENLRELAAALRP